MPTLYSCGVTQIRCLTCKPHLLCLPQMGLRGQRYGGFVVVGEYGGVLEVGGLGVVD